MIHSEDQRDLDHFNKKSDAIKFFDRDDRDLILAKGIALKQFKKLKRDDPNYYFRRATIMPSKSMLQKNLLMSEGEFEEEILATRQEMDLRDNYSL